MTKSGNNEYLEKMTQSDTSGGEMVYAGIKISGTD